MIGDWKFAVIIVIVIKLFDARVSAQTNASNATSPCRHFETRFLHQTGDSVLFDSPRPSCKNGSFDWTIHGRANLKLFVVFTKFYAVGSQMTIQTVENGAESTLSSCEHDRCDLIVGSSFLRIRHAERTDGDRRNFEVQALVGIAEPEPKTFAHGSIPVWALFVIFLLIIIALLQCSSILYFVRRKINRARLQAEFRKADLNEFSHLTLVSSTGHSSTDQLELSDVKEADVSIVSVNGNGPRPISGTLEHTEISSMVRNLSQASMGGDSSLTPSSAA
uniref:Uncharacterized protein n=1 Tax=Plectus sambesii TaxID=2011161 RepID=A0A914WZH2_9BILA